MSDYKEDALMGTNYYAKGLPTNDLDRDAPGLHIGKSVVESSHD